MDGLTKRSVKVRLSISFVIAIIWTAVMVVCGGFKDSVTFMIVLAPVLMTWSLTTLLFFPKEYMNEVIMPYLKIWVHLITFRFGEAVHDLINPLIWTVKALIKSIKTIFWAFSSH